MTKHVRWDTALEQRRAVDPGIDDPERRERARHERLNGARPITFLDVDGVLNAEQRSPGGSCLVETLHIGHERYQIRYNPRHGERLLTMAEKTGAELVWATSWEERANEFISPLVGLPQNLPVLILDEEFGYGSVPGVHPKTPLLVQYAQGRDFVWIDDQLGSADIRYLEDLRGKGEVGRFRLIKTALRWGLNDRQIDEAEAWLLNRAEKPS